MEELPKALVLRDTSLFRTVERGLGTRRRKVMENLDWLCAKMNPYFFITMKEEIEADLIFRRYRENHGKLLYTEISGSISNEINDHYAKLFAFFQAKPELSDQRLFRKALFSHLPAFIRESPKQRARVKDLPPKIKHAILASEIACQIVYGGGWEMDLESRVNEFLKREFS